MFYKTLWFVKDLQEIWIVHDFFNKCIAILYFIAWKYYENGIFSLKVTKNAYNNLA